MCAQDDWRAEDGVFEKEKFFMVVASLFEDDLDDPWCVETLAWWNEYVFLLYLLTIPTIVHTGVFSNHP